MGVMGIQMRVTIVKADVDIFGKKDDILSELLKTINSYVSKVMTFLESIACGKAGKSIFVCVV